MRKYKYVLSIVLLLNVSCLFAYTLTLNRAPEAVASTVTGATMVNEGASIQLKGSGSSDPEDGSVSAYQWEVVNDPTELIDADEHLSDATAANPSFTPPDIPDSFTAPVQITFGLKVKDSEELWSDPANDPNDEVIITINRRPTAVAKILYTVDPELYGDTVSALSGQVITLVADADGMSSNDPDGNTLSYKWSSDEITLLNDDIARPSFEVPSGLEEINIALKVTDSYGLACAADDTVRIIVNYRPVSVAAIAADDTHPLADEKPVVNETGDSIDLYGGDSYDPPRDAVSSNLSYEWMIESGPDEVSDSDISNDETDTATFTPPVGIDDAGVVDVVLKLVVKDLVMVPNANTDTDKITVRVNRTPVSVAAVSDATPIAGDTITLNGADSYDLDGADDIVSYVWTDVELGTGDPTIMLNGATHEFTVPAGKPSMTFWLAVADQYGLDTTDYVTLNIEQPPGILFVDASKTGSAETGTWNNPFLTIGSAVAASDADYDIIEVVVSDGTYDTYVEDVDLTASTAPTLVLRATTSDKIAQPQRRLATIKGTITMGNNTVLDGLVVEGPDSGAEPAVIINGVSNVEVMHNTIIANNPAGSPAELCGVDIVDPDIGAVLDPVYIHNNIVLIRVEGSVPGRGIKIRQSVPEDAGYILPEDRVKVINNTIDVAADDGVEAHGIYAEINNYYDSGTNASGLVVRNNIITVPRREIPIPPFYLNVNFCVFKVISGLEKELPIEYNGCYLWNWLDSAGNRTVGVLVNAKNHIVENPLFDDYNNDVFTLQNLSPCIDTGYPGDDHSNELYWDDPDDRDPYDRNPAINRGAYGNTAEAQLYNYGADIVTDGQVNILDLQLMMECWLTANPAADIAEEYGIVNLNDFQILASEWMY